MRLAERIGRAVSSCDGVERALSSESTPEPSSRPDIEFPLRVRGGDARGVLPQAERRDPRGAKQPPLPHLYASLLSAQGPFGLEVELKSEERLVGAWDIELEVAGAAQPARAAAHLYACASIRDDPRATGIFLVVRRWVAWEPDKPQRERLYESLSVAVLERLDSLLGDGVDESDEARSCVLFLVDGRRDHDAADFSLDRLQIRILEDLESAHAITGMDLRVAHGRGTGTRPQPTFAPTDRAPSPGEGPVTEPCPAPGTGPPRSRPSLVGEVFVRETLSPENMRWNRRSTDRRPNR